MPFELLKSEILLKGHAFTIRQDYLKTPDTGFLVKVGDRRSLGLRIAQLGSDPGLRKRISAHNKAYMNEFYIETCADRYLSAYRSLIEFGGESPCK